MPPAFFETQRQHEPFNPEPELGSHALTTIVISILMTIIQYHSNNNTPLVCCNPLNPDPKTPTV